MKSAEELESIIDTWARGETTTRSMVETLQQFELDAYKAGMSEAAQHINDRIAVMEGLGAIEIYRGCIHELKNRRDVILTARDNKTL